MNTSVTEYGIIKTLVLTVAGWIKSRFNLISFNVLWISFEFYNISIGTFFYSGSVNILPLHYTIYEGAVNTGSL